MTKLDVHFTSIYSRVTRLFHSSSVYIFEFVSGSHWKSTGNVFELKKRPGVEKNSRAVVMLPMSLKMINFCSREISNPFIWTDGNVITNRTFSVYDVIIIKSHNLHMEHILYLRWLSSTELICMYIYLLGTDSNIHLKTSQSINFFNTNQILVDIILMITP